MKKANIKEWFEKKLVNDGVIINHGGIYTFELFAILKETEKAVYAMCMVGTYGDDAIRKCIWIPKSVIENIENARRIDDYEKAVQAFEINH